MEKQGTGYAAREGGMGGDAYPCVRAFDATEVGSGITGERGGVARYKEREGIGGDALRGGEVGNAVREKGVRGDKTREDNGAPGLGDRAAARRGVSTGGKERAEIGDDALRGGVVGNEREGGKRVSAGGREQAGR